MANQDTNERRTASQDQAPAEQAKPQIDWEDPNVPVGDAPLMPRWPAALAAVAWLTWVGFLVVMILSGSPAAGA